MTLAPESGSVRPADLGRDVTLRSIVMTGPRSRQYDTAIVIPARNEARRIGRCLRAIANQAPGALVSTIIVMVANNCTDETCKQALSIARAASLDLLILDIAFPGSGSVGAARRIGVNAAKRMWPELAYFLGTDADCLVDGNWVSANRTYLKSVDCVCGNILPQPDEVRFLPPECGRAARLEYEYTRAMLEFINLMQPDPLNPWPHHGSAGGASLGFRYDAYRAVGGFSDLVCGEDRDLVGKFHAGGRTVLYPSNVRVFASCRLKGRAPGGMADALAARAGDSDSFADEALAPVSELMSRMVASERPGSSCATGLILPSAQRLRPSDLPGELHRLRHLTCVLRKTAPRYRKTRLREFRKKLADARPLRPVG